MLGLHDPHGVLADVEHRLGRRVFEIPTLPPSVPGMRLYEILRAALRGAGGRLVLGGEVTSSERNGDRLASVSTHAAGRDLTYVAPWFVLASGGFASGGIELDSHWVTHERVLGLPLRGVPAEGEPRFVGTYLDEQPMARVGVAVAADLRAEVVENVVVAGAALPGAIPWREGSGEGIALASGYRAAQVAGAPAAPRAATV
jgi:glycerol-3-phosphate dehydrogenase subunit B